MPAQGRRCLSESSPGLETLRRLVYRARPASTQSRRLAKNGRRLGATFSGQSVDPCRRRERLRRTGIIPTSVVSIFTELASYETHSESREPSGVSSRGRPLELCDIVSAARRLGSPVSRVTGKNAELAFESLDLAFCFCEASLRDGNTARTLAICPCESAV
jgi:hypothetical protein